MSLLPPVAAIAASAIAGPSADSLISRGVPVVTVRKAAQVRGWMVGWLLQCMRNFKTPRGVPRESVHKAAHVRAAASCACM